MNIFIYKTSPDIAILEDCAGVIDNYSSFNFTKSFKKIGTWSLKGLYTKELEDILKIGNCIYINKHICGLIDSLVLETDETGVTTYTAYGSELKNIMTYRTYSGSTDVVLNPGLESENFTLFLNHILTWYAGGYVSYDYDNTIGKYVPSNTRYKGILLYDDCSDSTPNAISPEGIQIVYKSGLSIADFFTNLVTIYDSTNKLPLGWDVQLVPYTCRSDLSVYGELQPHFIFLEGEDRTASSKNPIIFSRAYNNISTLTYTNSNKNSINCVNVIGGSEDADKKREIVTVKVAGKGGFSLREKTDDEPSLTKTMTSNVTLTDDQYNALLKNEGYKSYNADVSCLEATIVEKSQSLPDFSLLGAKVTVIDEEYGLQVNDWISEINFIDEGGDMEINYKIGTDIQAKKYIMEV